MLESDLRAAGSLSLEVTRANELVRSDLPPARELTLQEIAYHGMPRRDQSPAVRNWKAANFGNLWRGARRVVAARALGIPTHYGQLFLKINRADGTEEDLGLVSMRVVTNNGVAYIVQTFLGTVGYNLNNFKYHGLGTGTANELATDTNLGSELTTQYASDNTRATGTTVVGASANVFHTVATNTVDASAAVTEHGIFSNASVGSGTLLDRSKFNVVNLANGDSLTSTYDLTIAAGG